MRRHVRLVGALGILAVLVGVVLLRGAWVARGASRHGTTHPAAVAPTPCTTTSPWAVASTPNTPGGVLRATAATSRSDVWAVGYDYNSATQGNQTLIEHWNGSAWSIVPSPNTSSIDNQLYGVAALSPNDAWAVGYFGNSSTFPGQTLALHWDGSAWSIVPSPSPQSSGYNYLEGVSAVSASDVWAVGAYLDTSAHNDRTLIEHWDGVQWSIVASANPGTGTYPNDLTSVAAISANDVWAVGFYYEANPPLGALLEHWDGTSWTAVANPPVAILESIAAISNDDVWATGVDGYGNGLTLHWNGTHWSVVPSVNAAVTLQSVTAVAANDVWAVGYSYQSSSIPPVSEHWNGSSWSLVPLASSTYQLFGAVAIATNDVWAVGASTNDSGLVEHYPNLFQGAPASASRAMPHTVSRSPGGAIPCP